jgi:Sulfotransferase family
MLSLADRWLFIHVPKTGGNTLQAILRAHSEDRLTSDEYRDGFEDFEVEGDVTSKKHMSLQDYHDRLAADVYDRLFRFAVVRNPWERAISLYFGPILWKVNGGPPVWSKDRFVRVLDQLDPIISSVTVDGHLDVDMVLRFETLDQDARVLFHRLGYTLAALPHRNRGLVGKPWWSWYEREPDLVDVVGKRYAEDAETFGYTFEARRSTVLRSALHPLRTARRALLAR